MNVLESVDDPAEVIAIVARSCLKPGGNVIVLVPARAGIVWLARSAMGHKRRFSSSEMQDMLARERGFHVEQL